MQRIAIGFIMSLLLYAVPTALAQLPFIQPAGPLGGVGTDGTNLMINTDGDTDLELYPVPNGLLPTAQSQFFLTPSRQMLYAVKLLPPPPQTSPPCNSSHSVRVFIFRIVQQTDDGGTLDVVHDGVCLDEVADRGFFDPVDGAQRIAFISQRSDSIPLTQDVLWINLNGLNNSTFTTYTNDIGFIQFAPTGLTAFVQHDLTSGQPGADYTFTCLHPDAFGDQLATFAVNAGPAAQAFLETDQGGDTVIHVVHNEISQPEAFVSLDGCGPTAPEIGPCCRDQGVCDADQTAFDCAELSGNWLGPGESCSDCPPPTPLGVCCSALGFCLGTVTLAECAADGDDNLWLGEGSQCSQCPRVDLTLTKSGSDAVDAGDLITYTLQYENIGTYDAHNTVIVDYSVMDPTLPVIPSGNGVYDPDVNPSEVRWNLGTVPAGESGEVSVAIGTDCDTPSPVVLFGGSARITSDFGGNGTSFEIVSTNVRPLPNDPLEVVTSSLPSNGLPLFSGDIVTHTIELTNTIPEPREGVHFSIELHQGLEEFVATIDDGGGVVDTQFGFAWTGDIGPNETVVIVFTVQIADCLSPDQTDASLNHGNPFEILDACDSSIGTVTPVTPMPVQPSLTAKVTAINLDPPTELVTFISGDRVQAARDGDAVVLQIEVTNHLSVPVPLDIQFYIPFGLEASANPPFVPPTDVPASYNDAISLVSWSGTVDALSTIFITLDTTMSLPIDTICRVFISPTIDSGECTDMAERLVLQVLPPPPVDPRLVGVTISGGKLWWYAPGVDEAFSSFFCTNEEYTTDVAMTSNGDIWVTTAPLYRINPFTGDFEGYPHDFYHTLDLDRGSISHTAGDPTNNSIIFYGIKTMPGQTNGEFALRRYESLTGSVTPLPDLGVTVAGMIVDRDGMLVLSGGVESGLARFDLSSPQTPEPLMDDPFISFSELALDTDDDYIGLGFNNATGKSVLVEVDGTARASTVLIADIAAAVGNFWFSGDVAVVPNGDIYISDAFGGLARVQRDPVSLALVIEQNFSGFAPAIDHMIYMDPNALTQPADCDGDGAVNQDDWPQLHACMTGPIPGVITPGCACADIDGNDTVDLRDLSAAQSVFAGP